MLSKEAENEFRELYEKEFNEEIDEQTALDLAINLLTFFKCVYRPVKKEWLGELKMKED